jgi:hypothetical protein
MTSARALSLVLALAGILGLLGAGATPSARAATPDAGDAAVAFERANAAFAEGRYTEAADAYAAIAASHGSSPELLFNLANASFRAGRIGEAVLAWERARALAPRASEIDANLRQARRAAELPVPEATLWARLVALFSADAWAWLASACLAIACAAAVAAAALRARLATRPAAQRALRGAIIAVAGMFLVAAAAAGSALAALERGVVLGPEPVLRVAPYASATTGRALAAGEIVEIEREHGGFFLVRAADDRTGWIATEQVGRIKDLPGAAP